jgi:hypothetical protein
MSDRVTLSRTQSNPNPIPKIDIMVKFYVCGESFVNAKQQIPNLGGKWLSADFSNNLT